MNIVIVLTTFLLMEGATWVIHKYVMHGFLWTLHRDHHDHSNSGKMERNDYFFVIFALPAIALMYVGSVANYDYRFYLGLGITIYGMAYFFVHDVFIHQRITVFRKSSNPYLMAIRRAHKQHHRHIDKHDGECFGFLWVPVKYFRMYFNTKQQ